MADQNDEAGRRQAGRAWLAVGGRGHAGSLLWTSPQIRSFPPRRRRDHADLYRIDRERRAPGTDTPR